MKFEARYGLILFSDVQPGSYATMFDHRGAALVFRGDLSSLPSAPPYIWAFEHSFSLGAKQRFVFATADREVVGEVFGGEPAAAARVERDAEGKPLGLAVSPKLKSKAKITKKSVK